MTLASLVRLVLRAAVGPGCLGALRFEDPRPPLAVRRALARLAARREKETRP